MKFISRSLRQVVISRPSFRMIPTVTRFAHGPREFPEWGLFHYFQQCFETATIPPRLRARDNGAILSQSEPKPRDWQGAPSVATYRAWGPRQASDTRNEDAASGKTGARDFPTFHWPLRLRLRWRVGPCVPGASV
jgi:hypothetical protein